MLSPLLLSFESVYPNQHPISWVLRELNSAIWFRFHSLPESKRYPDDENERHEVLRRHNTVASEIFGEDMSVFLFVGKRIGTGANENGFVQKYSEDELEIGILGEKTTWNRGTHDKLILNVAEGHVESCVFFDPKTGDVYAPYDGGADLFIHNNQLRAQLKHRCEQWLSKEPSGM